MKRVFATVCATVCAAALLLCGNLAWAHRIDEYLQATLLSIEADHAEAGMRLIPGVQVAPAVIAAIDSNGDGVLSEAEQRAYAGRVLADLSLSADGKKVVPQLVSWSFPTPAQMREGLGEIHIAYRVALPQGGGKQALTLENRHQTDRSIYLMNVLAPQDQAIHILAQKRDARQSSYELDYERMAPPVAGWQARVRAWQDGVQFSALFELGMRHIAEGTDHLLFLLALLLPAPLLAVGRRLGEPAGARKSLLRILGIVTAFTLGHSITLALAALGLVSVPDRPVEALIAVSIFVSAWHAMRPIFPGREALIAGFFGLIHGLAFAATLDRLGLGLWERVAGILAFNLGIETMQMLVVAAILPSLLLLSGAASAYRILRLGGAAFAGLASLGWMLERILGLELPVDAVVDGFATHAPVIAFTLFLFSLACRMQESLKRNKLRSACS